MVRLRHLCFRAAKNPIDKLPDRGSLAGDVVAAAAAEVLVGAEILVRGVILPAGVATAEILILAVIAGVVLVSRVGATLAAPGVAAGIILDDAFAEPGGHPLAAEYASAGVLAEQRFDPLEQQGAAGNPGRSRRRRAQKPAATAHSATHKAAASSTQQLAVAALRIRLTPGLRLRRRGNLGGAGPRAGRRDAPGARRRRSRLARAEQTAEKTRRRWPRCLLLRVG